MILFKLLVFRTHDKPLLLKGLAESIYRHVGSLGQYDGEILTSVVAVECGTRSSIVPQASADKYFEQGMCLGSALGFENLPAMVLQ